MVGILLGILSIIVGGLFVINTGAIYATYGTAVFLTFPLGLTLLLFGVIIVVKSRGRQ